MNALDRGTVHAPPAPPDTGPVRHRFLEMGLGIIVGALAWQAGPAPSTAVAAVVLVAALILTRKAR